MAGDRIRIDELPTTILPSLEHVIAAMKDGESFGLTLEQVLSLYEPPTSPTLDAPTIQNILTLADAAKIRRWGVSDADIDALAPGPSAGLLFEAGANRHLTLGIQGANADTGLQVLDKGNGGSTYANQLLLLTRNALKYSGNDIWHAGNFPRGEELVASGAITTATPNLEVNLPATYKSFRIRAQHVRPNVATTGYFVGQMKANGTWWTGVSSYVWISHYVTGAGNHNFWGSGTFANAFALNDGGMTVSGSPGPSSAFEAILTPGSPTGNYPPIIMNTHMTYDNGNFTTGSGMAELGVNYRAEAIRLLFTAQQIGNMEWWVWGSR